MFVFMISPQFFFFTLIYLTLVVFLMSIDSFFVFWSLMEVSTLVFMGMMYSIFKNNFSQLLSFFVIQTVSAFSVLVFFILGFHVAFTAAILLKLSMFPFFFWYVNLVSFFPNIAFFMSSTIFKIPSLLLLYFFYDNLSLIMLYLSIVFTILVGAIIMVFSNDLRFLLVSSSIANNSWFVLAQECGLFFFFVYLLMYSMFFFLILVQILDLSSGVSLSLSDNGIVIFSMLSMAGMPPFPVFYMKMGIIYVIMSVYTDLVLFILFVMLFSVLMLLGYLKFVFYILMNRFTSASNLLFI